MARRVDVVLVAIALEAVILPARLAVHRRRPAVGIAALQRPLDGENRIGAVLRSERPIDLPVNFRISRINEEAERIFDPPGDARSRIGLVRSSEHRKARNGDKPKRHDREAARRRLQMRNHLPPSRWSSTIALQSAPVQCARAMRHKRASGAMSTMSRLGSCRASCKARK